jgi:hypothetical protein
MVLHPCSLKNNRHTNAFAGNIGAKLKVGPALLAANSLKTGDGAEWPEQCLLIDGEHGYYDNEMVILGRDKNAYTTDNAIIFNLATAANDQWLAGYDLPSTPNRQPLTALQLHKDTKTHKSNYPVQKSMPKILCRLTA